MRRADESHVVICGTPVREGIQLTTVEQFSLLPFTSFDGLGLIGSIARANMSD